MKIKRFKLILFCCFSLALPPAALAEDIPDPKTTGLFKILPVTNPSYAMNFTGLGFKSGAGWWALSCDSANGGCKLTRTKLKATRQQFSPENFRQYADTVVGQSLHWTPAPPPGTVLLFKSKRFKRAQGPVETYFFPIEGKEIFKEIGGTELELALPKGVKAQLLPVMVLPNPKDTRSSKRLTLELRIGPKRQTLVDGGFSLDNQDYLVWAGDLEGDGKLDLLIKTGKLNNGVALFLSSLAKKDELLGEAGRFEVACPEEEKPCD